jgi:hypothetical protein
VAVGGAGAAGRRSLPGGVDFSTSDGPEGPFRSLIQVRISSTERQACEIVKAAIQLAIQEALGDEASGPGAPGSQGIRIVWFT